MAEHHNAPESMLRFSGTPLEIGGEVWTRMCLPAIRKIGNERPPQELAQLYAGFLMGALGSLAADFGQEQAHQLAADLVASFERMNLDAGARTQ